MQFISGFFSDSLPTIMTQFNSMFKKKSKKGGSVTGSGMGQESFISTTQLSPLSKSTTITARDYAGNVARNVAKERAISQNQPKQEEIDKE